MSFLMMWTLPAIDQVQRSVVRIVSSAQTATPKSIKETRAQQEIRYEAAAMRERDDR
jgi:hypothetical protein